MSVTVEIRKRQGEATIDEVVASGVGFHIEQMSGDCYWFCLTNGDREWHFGLKSKADILLTCIEEPDTPVETKPTQEDAA